MTTPAMLLERYLRQRGELGEVELILEDPGVLRRSAPGARQGAAVGSSSASPSPGRATAEPAVDGGLMPPRLAPEPAIGFPPATPPTRPTAPPAVSTAAVRPELPATHPLTVLNVAASGCTACGLASTRTTVVFGEGNAQARLMVVGEAPGAEEDRTGRPFVGRAGVLLDRLLQSIGFPRESVYICNVLKCRPPGNRNPLPAEVEACSHFLRGQLEAISPRAILTVGTFPSQALLQTSEPIGRLRGTVHSFEGTPLVPTYHPAALLRNPGWIRPVWEDLQKLRRVVDAE